MNEGSRSPRDPPTSYRYGWPRQAVNALFLNDLLRHSLKPAVTVGIREEFQSGSLAWTSSKKSVYRGHGIVLDHLRPTGPALGRCSGCTSGFGPEGRWFDPSPENHSLAQRQQATALLAAGHRRFPSRVKH